MLILSNKNTMKCLLFLLLCTCLSGCSGIGSSEYIIIKSSPSAECKTRNLTLEEQGGFIIGNIKPDIYEEKIEDDLTYIIYPIEIKSTPWGLGPLFLPVIPWWWITYLDKKRAVMLWASSIDSKKINISWNNNSLLIKDIEISLIQGEGKYPAKVFFSVFDEFGYVYSYKFEQQIQNDAKLCISVPGIKKDIIIELYKKIYFHYGFLMW
jgi:hypothetical protein